MFSLKVICILCSVHFIGLFIFERLQRSNGNRSAIKINVVGKANDMDIILFLLNNFRFRHWKDVLIFLELCWDWRGPILTLHYLGYTVTNKTHTFKNDIRLSDNSVWLVLSINGISCRCCSKASVHLSTVSCKRETSDKSKSVKT